MARKAKGKAAFREAAWNTKAVSSRREGTSRMQKHVALLHGGRR